MKKIITALLLTGLLASYTTITQADEIETPPLTTKEMGYTLLLKLFMAMQKETLFTLDYRAGYNLNFRVTEEELRELLPDNLVPLKLKLLESDPQEQYYISWYLAGLGSESITTINRLDVFTYITDENGDMGLYFLSGVMQMPNFIRRFGFTRAMYEELLEFLARDSLTGKAAYPHFYADTFVASKDEMSIHLGDSFIEFKDCSIELPNEQFSMDFILANSQIYRTARDKNTNYFNQSFIKANVEMRAQDCIQTNNIEFFHPLLKMENLDSVHFYGSDDKDITWYFEM